MSIKQLPVEFEFNFDCSRPQPNYEVIGKGTIKRCTISFPKWQAGYYILFKFYNYNTLVYELPFYDRDFGFRDEMALLDDCRGYSAERMAESFLYKLLVFPPPLEETPKFAWSMLRSIFEEFVTFYEAIKTKQASTF